MKEDVEIPSRPPKKRRQLEAALDVWLAVWANDEKLTPSERRRVQEERDRRKAANPEVIVGFTATREGMTKPQKHAVREELIALGPTEAHHGDCVGGDEQFHSICRGLKIPVVLHPPSNGALRAYCQGAIRSEPAKEFTERNKDIVRETSVLFGAPKEEHEPESLRGHGTWSTIKYARKRGSPVKVWKPNGEQAEVRDG